jgi:exo-1,4-beta-D-glucosaminidase
MKRQIAILMCLVAIAAARCLGSTDSPNLTELQNGWRMTSASDISVGDAQVSLPALDVSEWYNAQRMPATVLQILEDNGVYKNLYYGTNLSTPKNL